MVIDGQALYDITINDSYNMRQIDLMLISRKAYYYGKNISDTGRHVLIHTIFWRHLWSFTEQTHGNMEFVC